MKTIRTFFNVGQADFAQSLLEASNIESDLLDDSVLGLLAIPQGLRLQVDDADYDRALEILDSNIPETDIDDQTPQLPVIPEHEVEVIHRAERGVICPNCSTAWDLTPDEAALPTYTCQECKTTFSLADAKPVR